MRNHDVGGAATAIRLLRLFAVAALILVPCFAQPVIVRPDCVIVFHFTTAGQHFPTSPNDGLNNLSTGCTTWNVSFNSQGFTAVNLILQSAPNSTAVGAPGSYATYANQTVLTGTNPLVGAIAGAAGFAWVVGYNPWVRVLLFSATGSGTVDGVALGWAIPSASSMPTGSQNVVITGPLGQAAMAASIPVVIASDQSYGNITVTSIPDVTATGSAQPIAISGTAKFVQVVAASTNSATIRCGGTGTSATAGVPIAPGGSESFLLGQVAWNLANLNCIGTGPDKYAIIYGQ